MSSVTPRHQFPYFPMCAQQPCLVWLMTSNLHKNLPFETRIICQQVNALALQTELAFMK